MTSIILNSPMSNVPKKLTLNVRIKPKTIMKEQSGLIKSNIQFQIEDSIETKPKLAKIGKIQPSSTLSPTLQPLPLLPLLPNPILLSVKKVAEPSLKIVKKIPEKITPIKLIKFDEDLKAVYEQENIIDQEVNDLSDYDDQSSVYETNIDMEKDIVMEKDDYQVEDSSFEERDPIVKKMRLMGEYYLVGVNIPYIYSIEDGEKIGKILPDLSVEWYTFSKK